MKSPGFLESFVFKPWHNRRMKLLWVFANLILIFAFLSLAGSARADDPASPSRRDENLFFGLPGGLVQTAPRLFTNNSLYIFLAGTAFTASVWNTPKERGYDDYLERTAKHEGIYDAGNFWGNGLCQGVLAVGTWGAGRIFHKEKCQAFGFDAATALVGSAGVAWGLKFAVNRTRPNGAQYSFPSGHTCSAFSIVPAAWKYWGWEAGLPAILLGVTTGLGRMEDHMHYLSDVAAGATIGLLVGQAACGAGGPWVPQLKLSWNRPTAEWTFKW
jgi:membrane-associated phospholipid phosphatase